MPEVRATEWYDKDREILGYVNMIYDDQGRVHTFGVFGETDSKARVFSTPKEAMADYKSLETLWSGADRCECCRLRKMRVI